MLEIQTVTITKQKNAYDKHSAPNLFSLVLLLLLMFYLLSPVFIGVKEVETNKNKRRRRQQRWPRRLTKRRAGRKWPQSSWLRWSWSQSRQFKIRRPRNLFLLLLVFAGEKGCQDKGEEEGGRRGDGSSSCQRCPKTRRSRKKCMMITRLFSG